SAKVRVFADWIAEVFEPTPALEGGENWRRNVRAKVEGEAVGSVVA
ncbi:LysR family transcriptional regulator, partial [Burkholderia multivorans]